jgi:hypothetical protein
MTNVFKREQRLGKRLAGVGAALLLAALMAPAGAADFEAGSQHPCQQPWAAAGNNGGKMDRHHVGRHAVKYCTAETIKEAANVPQPQPDRKPVVDR